MLDLLSTEIVKGLTGIARDIIGKRLIAYNDNLAKHSTDTPKTHPIVSEHNFKTRLQRHISDIRQWSAHSSFFDLMRRRDVDRIYVDLETYLIPIGSHMSGVERLKTRPLMQCLLQSNSHCVLLGQPGAGKTTSIQKLCVNYFSTGKVLLNHDIPIVVRLRDVSTSRAEMPLFEQISQIIGLDIHGIPWNEAQNRFSRELPYIKRDIVLQQLDFLRAALLIDGLDEVADDKCKANVISDIRTLALGLRNARMILTCRSGEYGKEVENMEKYEISSLSKQQIQSFAVKWLGDEDSANRFLNQVGGSPFADTAIRPLTMAHLCAIYERLGQIPDEPRSIYRKIIYLLLEEWDSQRSIRRQTKYSKFTIDRKFDFLSALAYQLTALEKRSQFSTEVLEELYGRLCARFALPHGESKSVAKELESHTGLLIQSGYQSYEFAHKSLQEYLTAEYIVRLSPLSSISEKLPLMPEELAIAVSLSSSPGDYLADIVFAHLEKQHLDNSYYEALLSRIIIEKPDFSTSQSAILVAAFIMTKFPKDQRLPIFFRNIFTPGATKILNHFYSDKIDKTDHFKYIGPRRDHYELLPQFLTVSKSLLN